MTRVDVFEQLFLVFLGLGTIVGVVVVVYTLYNAYKYRDVAEGDEYEDETERPQLGELPTGGAGGRKLFLSFGISAIIVIGLIIWAYTMLVYVEAGPDGNPAEDALEVDVEGVTFAWLFYYYDDDEDVEFQTVNEMVIPADTTIWITVTATDVWHTFGVSDLRVKADAIPGEYDQTWFIAEEEGTYTIECFELCGDGHSGMIADLEVVSEEEYDEWFDERVQEELDEAEDDDNGADDTDETNTDENGDESDTDDDGGNDDGDTDDGGDD